MEEIKGFSKIDDLKKKIFQNNLKEAYLNREMQYEETGRDRHPYKSMGYVPKMKTKVKMLEIKPVAVDMTEVIKKKLLAYAKNLGSYCERFNL